MITQNPDGSLAYKDTTGNPVTVRIFDGDFSRVEGVLSQQIAADNANRAALSMYMVELASSQKQIDMGVPMVDIPIPVHITVDDQGNKSESPYTGLPVLNRAPKSAPPTNVTSPAPPAIVSGAAAADLERHQTYLMVKALFNDKYPTG